MTSIWFLLPRASKGLFTIDLVWGRMQCATPWSGSWSSLRPSLCSATQSLHLESLAAPLPLQALQMGWELPELLGLHSKALGSHVTMGLSRVPFTWQAHWFTPWRRTSMQRSQELKRDIQTLESFGFVDSHCHHVSSVDHVLTTCWPRWVLVWVSPDCMHIFSARRCMRSVPWHFLANCLACFRAEDWQILAACCW